MIWHKTNDIPLTLSDTTVKTDGTIEGVLSIILHFL